MGTIQEALVKANLAQVHSKNKNWGLVYCSLAELADIWNLYRLRVEIIRMLITGINEIEMKVFISRRWKGDKLVTEWFKKVLINCKNCETVAERKEYLNKLRNEAWRDYQETEIIWPVRIRVFNNFDMEKSNWAFHNFEQRRKKAIRKKLLESSRLLLGARVSFPYFSMKEYLDILTKEIIVDI